MEITKQTPIAALSVGQFLEILANKMATPPIPEHKPSKHLTLDEVCELTGYARPTIYKMCGHREIPYYKPSKNGKRLVFVRSEIEEWMQARRFQTHEEFVNECL